MDGTLGELRIFAGAYAPAYWHICDGTILDVLQNRALFSILGYRYGGNGTTTFALPDLRDAMPIGSGASHRSAAPPLMPLNVGDTAGQDEVTLSLSNFPLHTHNVRCNNTTGSGTQNNPADNYMGVGPTTSTGEAINTRYATDPTTGVAMAADAVSTVGGSDPVSLQQPTLVLNYIICVDGPFPNP